MGTIVVSENVSLDGIVEDPRSSRMRSFEAHRGYEAPRRP